MMRETLTEREKQVAAHLSTGLRIAGVANELDLAENTVRNHIKRAFFKLDVHTQSEMIELLRQDPSIVAPYHVVAGLPADSDRALSEEMIEVDRAVEKRIEECAASARGADGMKKIIRTVLPLDEASRREWRVRLAAHVVGPQQRVVREVSSDIRHKWSAKPLLRIRDLQARGWIHEDLDTGEVRRRLFSAVYAAALALLADTAPEEQQRQLAVIDRLLEEIAPDGDPGA